MISLQIIRKCLTEWAQIIICFEGALRSKYFLDDHPYLQQHLFPKADSFKFGNAQFNYNFHGSGCSVYCQGQELLFDYDMTSQNYLLVSPWKFTQFLKGLGFLQADISEVADKLEELHKEGTIIKRHPDYLEYYVDFSKIKNKRCTDE